MADTGVIDAARQEEFVGKVVEQISGTMTTLLGAVGDRLGLFKNLAEQGPATSAELASRTNLNERYLREWLGGMVTEAGIIGTDFISTFVLAIDYRNHVAHHAALGAGCSSDTLFNAGFAQLSTLGFYGSQPSALRPMRDVDSNAAADAIVPNVPTVTVTG